MTYCDTVIIETQYHQYSVVVPSDPVSHEEARFFRFDVLHSPCAQIIKHYESEGDRIDQAIEDVRSEAVGAFSMQFIQADATEVKSTIWETRQDEDEDEDRYEGLSALGRVLAATEKHPCGTCCCIGGGRLLRRKSEKVRTVSDMFAVTSEDFGLSIRATMALTCPEVKYAEGCSVGLAALSAPMAIDVLTWLRDHPARSTLGRDTVHAKWQSVYEAHS